MNADYADYLSECDFKPKLSFFEFCDKSEKQDKFDLLYLFLINGVALFLILFFLI